MNSIFSRALLWSSLFLLANAALAGPDPCPESGGERTCAGNQSDGIRITSGPNDLAVKNLTADIAPAAETIGVRFSRNGGPGDDGGYSPVGAGGSGDTGGTGGAPALTLDLGDWSIVTYNAHGVLAQANGGRGGDGGEATGIPIPPFYIITGPAFGGNGGRGGAGGSVVLNVDGSITTNGNSAIGIFAESRGGRGGNGGWAFSTTYAEGGNGGSGGDGGNVFIENSASVTTISAECRGAGQRSSGVEVGSGVALSSRR